MKTIGDTFAFAGSGVRANILMTLKGKLLLLSSVSSEMINFSLYLLFICMFIPIRVTYTGNQSCVVDVTKISDKSCVGRYFAGSANSCDSLREILERVESQEQ